VNRPQWFFKFFLLSALSLLVASCGTNQSQPVPTPIPPNLGGFVGLPDPGTTTDPRLTYFSKSVHLTLPGTNNSDTTGFQALMASNGNGFTPPMVDTIVQMAIDSSNSLTPAGDIRVGIEDGYGFWGAIVPSFTAAGYRSGTAFRMISSNSLFTLKVSNGGHSGDDFWGTVFYRIRQSGEHQCLPQSDYCSQYYGWPYWGSYPPECNPSADLVTPCVNYMNQTSNPTKVFPLGSFTTQYSNWVQ
jgi:hypothetical protein